MKKVLGDDTAFWTETGNFICNLACLRAVKTARIKISLIALFDGSGILKDALSPQTNNALRVSTEGVL
jgi:hypothetical protein